MKKYLLLVISIAFLLTAKTSSAQSVTFTMNPTTTANIGEQICIPITVMDFSFIGNLEQTYTWDHTVLSFSHVANIHNSLADVNLGTEDFNTANASDGILTLNWETDINATPCQASIADGETIFELCFDVIGTYGDNTPIHFSDISTGRVIGDCGYISYNIGEEILVDGFVSIAVIPLIISGNHVSGNQNGTACVEFTVANFSDIATLQFTVAWDPTIITHASHSSDILSSGNYGEAFLNDGFLTVSYDPLSDNRTLDDGTVLFRICFNIIGECDEVSSVAITSDKTPIQVSNSTAQIGLFQEDGTVSVSCFIPGAVSFCLGNKTIEVGELFTIPVTVKNFNSITSMVFDMNWDPTQIHYSGTTDYDSTLSISSGNFSTGQTNSGTLSFHWGNFCIPFDLPDNTVLFSIRFVASGNPGTSSVSIPNDDEDISIQDDSNFCDGSNLLVTNVCSGNITINTPVGITITAPTMSVLVGDEFCIPLTVRDFDSIYRTNYSVLWDPGIIEFVEISEINPTLATYGLDNSDFDLTSTDLGSFCLNWVTIQDVTLPNDAVLFKICYRALDNPGNCSPVIIGSEEPGCPTLITSKRSNEENIGLHSYNGNICVVDEVLFGLTIPSENAMQGSTACLDVLTTDFTQLTTFGFSLNWDETVIHLDNITTTDDVAGFDETNFDLSAANSGTATVSWIAADHPNGGVTLQDSSILFTLCYTIIGTPPNCSSITFGGDPQPITVNSEVYGTSNIGMTGVNGQICSEYPYSILNHTVSQVTCPDAENGAIDITVVGGTPPYSFFWTTPSGNFNTEDIANIAEGNCSVTITDSSLPAIQIEETYVIGLSPTIPVANAGDDYTKICSESDGSEISTITLNGAGSTTEAGYTYLWETNTGGTITDETTLTPTITGSGNFIINVTETASGCTVRDTVNIQPAVMPTADAGSNEAVICTLALDGTNSYNTPPLDIAWSTLSGHIVSGENSLTPTIDKPGAYRLTLTIPTTHCKSTDLVIIAASEETPFADAGNDKALNCNADPVIIGGENTSQGDQFSYSWTTMEGGVICDGTPTNTPTASVCAVGIYVLAVTNTNVNCTKTDTVIISNGPDRPDISAGIDTALTCTNDAIQLVGDGPIDDNFSVTWTASDGGVITGGNTTYSPTISHTGTYTLTVHDIANDCYSTDVVTVGSNTTPPLTNAGVDTVLTCTHPTINLTGFPFGVNYSHEWSGCADCISDVNSPFPTVNEGGTFTLTITDLRNGCIGTDQVFVDVDTISPTILIATPAPLSCANTLVTLDASGSSTGSDYSYEWNSPEGHNITDETTLTPQVSDSGQYILTVNNDVNGCVNTNSIAVEDNSIDITVNAGFDITIEDCISSEASFNAIVTPAGDYNIQWTALTTGEISTGENTLTPTVNGVGFYEITVTQDGTGCSAVDTIEVKPNDNIQLPEVNVGDDQSITSCTDSTSVLSAIVNQSTNYTIHWTAPIDGIIVSGEESLNPTVQGFGEFILEIVDNGTHCPGYDTIAINNGRIYPTVNAGDDITLTTCGEPTGTALHGTITPIGSYEITWSSENGNNILNSNTLDPTADGFGPFVLTVVNNTTGCSGTDMMMIIDGGSGSFEVNAGEDISVTSCTNTTTLLHGLPPSIDNYSVHWISLDGNAITNENSLEPTVEGFGFFVMTITDTDSECSGRDTIQVIDNSTPLEGVSAGTDLHITSCSETEFTLHGSISSSTNYTVSWSAVNTGQIIGNGSTLEPTVSGFDLFEITITDNTTQCRAKDTVQVFDDSTPLEGVSAGEDLHVLQCDEHEFDLDGSVTSTTDYTVSWAALGSEGQIINNGNTLQPLISGFDSFEITITDNVTQCRGKDTVEIINDATMPDVNAGANILIECGGSDTVTIVGSGTDGDEISHTWATINGNILTDPAQYTVDAKGTGIYVLTVTNNQTSCISADTMEVIVNTSAEPATATYTGESCSSEILLQGNLPENATGLWTTSSSAVIEDSSAPETTTTDLENGTYEFVWTLSTADCPNYSSAVVSYSLPASPTAMDDNFILIETQTSLDFNVLINDIILEDTSKWSLNLLSTPQNGALLPTTERGQYNYTPLAGFSGAETFTYSICLDTCQLLCDTATVNIEVQIEDFVAAEIPTGITPNGDGKNDMFVFEMLTDQTIKYPDNEIIIFNRWGDVVYQAKPYLNNWEGTNSAGQPLPHATYYYVLRLDLSKSIIIRGNVTILK